MHETDNVNPRRALTAISSLFLAAVFSASCQVVGGYDEFEVGVPAKVGAQAHACDVVVEKQYPTRKKSGLHGPNLLLIDDPSVQCFWMDETEVTVAQYRAWLTDIAGESSLVWDGSNCAEKPGSARPFDPDGNTADCVPPKELSIAPFDDGQPIRCVDWCEADAFCQWAGKRLCKVAPSDEWQTACTADYTQQLPFDASAEGSPCNYGQTNCSLGCGPRPVKLEKSCRPAPGYPYDLGGNVAEWIDSCSRDANGTTNCKLRGGSYLTPEAKIRCSNSQAEGVAFGAARDPGVGFRCCAGLTESERLLLPD